MGKYTIEMSWNHDETEYRQFLQERGITHIKEHNSPYFKVGDALRSRKGLTVRVMSRFANYENYSEDYTIANNSSSVEELYKNFGYPSIQGSINMQLQKDLQR
jgi:hypothetical protein